MLYLAAVGILLLMGIIFVLLRILWLVDEADRDRDVYLVYLREELLERGLWEDYRYASDVAYVRQRNEETQHRATTRQTRTKTTHTQPVKRTNR